MTRMGDIGAWRFASWYSRAAAKPFNLLSARRLRIHQIRWFDLPHCSASSWPAETAGTIPGAAVPQMIAICGFILLLFAYTGSMFQAPAPGRGLVIRCKRCGQNIPAPVETVPAQPIAAKCLLCAEYRRYLPSEVFQGRLSHMLIKKPVRTADGRPGG